MFRLTPASWGGHREESVVVLALENGVPRVLSFLQVFCSLLGQLSGFTHRSLIPGLVPETVWKVSVHGKVGPVPSCTLTSLSLSRSCSCLSGCH